ncbi:hypothetical protein LENED_004335 [Lentinula edodes]|uniref:Uncharacterized protein n=1 Tax=Lentinula edodes TaxID=5353 RepID=A0A1Q3E618_LENED|nr:hypothetical protein LENED_004335 [Lentinula edodes]
MAPITSGQTSELIGKPLRVAQELVPYNQVSGAAEQDRALARSLLKPLFYSASTPEVIHTSVIWRSPIQSPISIYPHSNLKPQ